MSDLYAGRSVDDNGELLCTNPEEDASDVIALHLAHEADPVKAIADFCRLAAEEAEERKEAREIYEASRDGWNWYKGRR